jgi:hypothetical protein
MAMRYINVQSVILGSAVTFLLDLLVGSGMLFTFARDAFDPTMTEAETTAVLAALAQNPSFLLVGFVLGSTTTIAGGFISARMARRLPYMNAAAVGVVGIVQGLLLMNDSAPWWFTALGFLINIPAALVGGHLAKRRLDAAA